jgi:uncharacterized protein
MISLMKALIFSVLVLFSSQTCFTQNESYSDSLQKHIDNYVNTHGVVKGDDKKNLQFYPVNEKFRIVCRFERKENSHWFKMEHSGPLKRNYRIYGKIHFKLNDTAVMLCIYQSEDLMKDNKYKDHLFIPFIDATAGEETYESGRYIDLNISDLAKDQYVIDFNKAYNPYCAYVSNVYNCPVPPKENRLNIAIPAGEKKYLKSH